MNKLVEVIKKDSSIIIIDESNKYELNENLILPILNEQDILQLTTSDKILKEFTIQQWVGIVMPIIKRTSTVRSSVAGKEKTLSHFLGISGTPASPVIHFKTKATYSNDYYRTKIQLVDLNKWRQGKYLYSMNNKEFSEILRVCEIRFSCNCKFYHWGGLKYMATELDSSIDKTSIPNPVWRTRKGYSEPSLCKHLKGVLRLIKPNSNKILGLLKDKFSAKFRKENMTSRYERIFKEGITSANEVKLIYNSIMKIIEMDRSKFQKIIELTSKIKYNSKNEVLIPQFVEIIKIINSYTMFKVNGWRQYDGNKGYVGKSNELWDIINKYSQPIQSLFVRGSEKYDKILNTLQLNFINNVSSYTMKIFDMVNYNDSQMKDYIIKNIIKTAGERKESVEETKQLIIQIIQKCLKKLQDLEKQTKQFFASIKSQAPEVEEFKYKGVTITITKSSTDPDPKELIEITKHCLDQLEKEKLGFLFPKCKINIVDAKTFKTEYGGSGSTKAYAFYSRDKQIYMPNNEVKNLNHFMKTFYHEFGHYVHLGIENKEVYNDWLNIYNYVMNSMSAKDKVISNVELKKQLEGRGIPVKKVTYISSGKYSGTYQIDLTFVLQVNHDTHIKWLFNQLAPGLNKYGYLDMYGNKFGEEGSFEAIKGKMKYFYLKLPEQSSSQSNKNLIPSQYSGKNEKELFAEIFAYVMMPNYAHYEIHPDLLQAFKNVIRGIHGVGFKEEQL